jgi:hypothetical protein
MSKIGLVLVFAASLSFAQSPAGPVELTSLPPKPTCGIILRNGACADLWRNYNQAVAQRLGEQIKNYANRQAQLAAGPLEQQVADLTKLAADEQAQIKSLQEQMQADAVAAVEAKADAHTAGLQKGAILGAGGMLLLVGIMFGIRKYSQGFTVTKKEQAKAASA